MTFIPVRKGRPDLSKPCGRGECMRSTGICGRITCGTGRLDFSGYWQFPCHLCEAWYDENWHIDPETGDMVPPPSDTEG